jgi:hypothetical protein
VLLSLAWGWCPAWAADEPFTPPEERAILEAVSELQAAREEIGTLKAALTKDAVLIDSLRVQITALERLSATQERMLATAEKLGGLQDRAVQTYRDLAAASDLRAERAEARAERAETIGKWAGPIGALMGIGLTVALAVFAR